MPPERSRSRFLTASVSPAFGSSAVCALIFMSDLPSAPALFVPSSLTWPVVSMSDGFLKVVSLTLMSPLWPLPPILILPYWALLTFQSFGPVPTLTAFVLSLFSSARVLPTLILLPRFMSSASSFASSFVLIFSSTLSFLPASSLICVDFASMPSTSFLGSTLRFSILVTLISVLLVSVSVPVSVRSAAMSPILLCCESITMSPLPRSRSLPTSKPAAAVCVRPTPCTASVSVAAPCTVPVKARAPFVRMLVYFGRAVISPIVAVPALSFEPMATL